MSGQDEVGAAADVQALSERVAGILQFASLGHEEVGGNDAAVANDVDFTLVKDSGGDGAEHEFFAIEDDGVAGVRAARKACHYIVARSEIIHHFTFAFVAEDNA